jgi:hypothetical protein
MELFSVWSLQEFRSTEKNEKKFNFGELTSYIQAYENK